MSDGETKQQLQQQRTDKMEAFLRENAEKDTPWEKVLEAIKKNFNPSDVVCLIDRLNPNALNLRLIYEGIKKHRY